MRRRLTRVAVLAACALGAAACAGMQPPPGGPTDDKSPPALLRASVDSGAVNARPRGAIAFQFDEVLNERPAGATSLSQLVLISPRDGAPRVSWHRSRLDVRPRRDWRPNTVYTITLLPGISDLQNNVRKSPITLLFSTGATIPNTRVSGAVFDWAQGTPSQRAVVEAIARDSTTFIAAVDSTGRYTIAHVAPGPYTLRGFVDANSNRALDEREPWDSVAITISDTLRADLYVFVHDTIGPRIATVDVRDSVTLRVTLDRPVDPRQTIDTTLFSLRAADSSAVPVRSARAARDYERARAESLAAQDTSARPARRPAVPVPGAPRRAAGDTTPALPPPKPERPLPVSDVILQVFPPLKANATYRLEARRLRGLTGAVATSQRSFSTPAAPAARPPATPAPGQPGAPSPTRPPPAGAPARPPVAPDSTRRPPP